MNIARNIGNWLLILCVPFMLFTATVRIASNSAALYRYGFNKYNISQATRLSSQELENVIGGLITYFNSDEEAIHLTAVKDGKSFELFNEREVGHLKDVKGLFRLVFRVLLGTLIYAMVFILLSSILRQDKRRIARDLIWGSGLTLAVMAVLGVIMWVNFDWFWLQFHFLSFANDLWALNPATDYLIMLFPQGFWFDAASICAAVTAVLALILGATGLWRLRKDKTATA